MVKRWLAAVWLGFSAFPLASGGQETSMPAFREEEVKRRMEEVEEEAPLFLVENVGILGKANEIMGEVSEVSPVAVGAEASFLSDWLDEGANGAKKGLQIQQVYFAEVTHGILEDFEIGAGFEYFQIDTTGAVPGPSTLERDYTIYAPLAWRFVSVTPMWTYVQVPDPEGDDSVEIGCEVSLDLPLQPTMAWNYDHDDLKGHYFEWSLSQDLPLKVRGQTLSFLTPSVALGMDSRKASEHTTLTHIDFGLALTVPLMEGLAVTGLLHFTKGLGDREEGYVDIVPWGGVAVAAEF